MNIRAAYNRQKARAKDRNIEWFFTFDEWLFVCESSGKANLRGKGRGKYVMARIGDVGPYCKENIEIILYEQNCADARTNYPRTTFDLRSRQIGTGRGWTRVGKNFQVTVSKKYIGTFYTQEDAEAAYKKASIQFLESCSLSVAGINPQVPEDHRK